MTNYRKGVAAEKKTRRWLESIGFFVVEARGSHGACDMVALSAQGVLVIQVKSGRKLYGKEYSEMIAALRAVPLPSNGRRQVVTWTPYARVPAVEDV